MTESTFAADLVAALAELTVIERGRTANMGTYSYDYADLGDIVTVTRPALAKHGIVAVTPVSGREGGLQVGVTLIHSSGERLEFDPLFFPASNNPQAAGSSITYYRRYALLAALGIATGDDDDGAAAVASPPVRMADAATVKYIRDAVAAITDEELRKEVQAGFKAEFGPTASLPADRADEAKAWIDQAVPA